MIDLLAKATNDIHHHPEYKLSWGFLGEKEKKENFNGNSTGFFTSEKELFVKAKGLNNFIRAILDDDKNLFIGQKTTFNDSHDKKTEGFNYFDDWDKCIDCFLNNPLSLKEFTENEEKLTEHNSSGNSVEYDKTGDFLDVSKFLGGDMDCFGSMTDGNLQNRYMNLIITIGGNAGVSNGELRAYAEIIQEIVDFLENNKIRCKVEAFTTNECSTLQLTVKDYDEPLSLSDIFVITNPDFFRRLYFRVAERSPTIDYSYGLGNVSPYITALAEENTPTLYFKKRRHFGDMEELKEKTYEEVQKAIDNWDNNPTPLMTL